MLAGSPYMSLTVAHWRAGGGLSSDQAQQDFPCQPASGTSGARWRGIIENYFSDDIRACAHVQSDHVCPVLAASLIDIKMLIRVFQETICST